MATLEAIRRAQKKYRQKHPEKIREYQRQWYSRNRTAMLERSKNYRQNNNDEIKKRKKTYHINNPKRNILCRARTRARKLGICFDLTIEDIQLVDVCPILGLSLDYSLTKPADNSPSIDRIRPELGYVKDNVHIISNRANRIKNDATLEELQKVAKYFERYSSPEDVENIVDCDFDEDDLDIRTFMEYNIQ